MNLKLLSYQLSDAKRLTHGYFRNRVQLKQLEANLNLSLADQACLAFVFTAHKS